MPEASTEKMAHEPLQLAPRWRVRLARRLALGLYSRSVHIGMRRRIPDDFQPPRHGGLAMRALTDALRDAALPTDTSGFDDAERVEIEIRRGYAERLPGRGHVVVDLATGEPCYLMWVLGARDNDIVARLDGVPPLEPHQALVEGAYVPPAMRGRGIMTPAGLMVLARAAELGATEILSFIGETNLPSLKGALRAGFEPHRRHVRHHFLFGLVKIDRYGDLAAEHPLQRAAPTARGNVSTA